ncbi:methyltransferase domain-containing protein [Rubrobacter marinus]|uniref:Methyltransferase domain-containing protein n=1 Tax=Rubrobacter marinus TaxID=2653852 RepID=A0A6G8PYE0_9ACTN|nr:methyltransferase [Rubrobacter marinus]QIN79264.1 methyltransferase domain-containing protein [Rubrobacter marinus]
MDHRELDWRGILLLGTALREGLLEAVADGARPAPEVAGALGLDERAVRIVLSALAELGALEETDEGFRLQEEHRRPLLDPEDPGYVGASVAHRLRLLEGWVRLPEVLKTGEPVENRTAPAFEGTETFVRALRRTGAEGAAEISSIVLSLLPEGASLLDVGGGPAANAEAFARDGARVTVFDRPEVLELMRGHLDAAGIASVAGDMNERLPEGPFDAVYFGNTSHMYGPEENKELFARMRRALAPGGLLVVREFVRGTSEEAALFAVNMLVLTPRGNTYTASEYEEWLRDVGFAGVEVVPIPGLVSHLVLARLPG